MMRLLKWLTVFVVAFIIAWIVIFTFIQDEFKQLASAQLLGYETPEIPVYLFVAGAFGLGFLLGLACLLVNYIALSAGIHKHKKRIKELEGRLRAMEQDRMGAPEHEPSGPSLFKRGDDRSLDRQPREEAGEEQVEASLGEDEDEEPAGDPAADEGEEEHEPRSE